MNPKTYPTKRTSLTALRLQGRRRPERSGPRRLPHRRRLPPNQPAGRPNARGTSHADRQGWRGQQWRRRRRRSARRPTIPPSGHQALSCRRGRADRRRVARCERWQRRNAFDTDDDDTRGGRRTRPSGRARLEAHRRRRRCERKRRRWFRRYRRARHSSPGGARGTGLRRRQQERRQRRPRKRGWQPRREDAGSASARTAYL